MGRTRALSNASTSHSSAPTQELGSMYDYLAKIVLLGPSGAGKSCVLHRFVRDEWRVLSSQTIGVEFSSKIVHIADRKSSAHSRKRIKLQLWDTAGTERFRSVSRSYYRGAAGAILVYDVSSWRSFEQLQTFLNDARALAGPDITIILAQKIRDPVRSPIVKLRSAGLVVGSVTTSESPQKSVAE
jgi:Ras-related protein Rab-4B